MNDLFYFNYSGNEIRSLNIGGATWWVLTDVCKVLDISNASIVAGRLDDDEVTKLDLGGQVGITNLVNESGLYSVIIRSDKPQAKPFRRWVTHEVLPQIRKFGRYEITGRKIPNVKKWYGVEVFTTIDVGDMLGISRSSARDHIIRHFRDGLDYFILKGESLKRFKYENSQNYDSSASAVIVIKAEAFYSLDEK